MDQNIFEDEDRSNAPREYKNNVQALLVSFLSNGSPIPPDSNPHITILTCDLC